MASICSTETTVHECEHDLQPVYISYSSNDQRLECYRCSKCGAVFGTSCITFINSTNK